MAEKRNNPGWWPPTPETLAAIDQIFLWIRMAACLAFGAWGLHHEALEASTDPQLIPVFATIFAYPFFKWGDSKK